jgi:hypothetical protein
LPAAIAFCRAVYWSLPVPALTRLTLTFGYFCWKLATTCLRVGSQAQTVSVPPFCSAAWTSASLVRPLVVLLEEPPLLLPQAARTKRAAAAATLVKRRVMVRVLSRGFIP